MQKINLFILLGDKMLVILLMGDGIMLMMV